MKKIMVVFLGLLIMVGMFSCKDKKASMNADIVENNEMEHTDVPKTEEKKEEDRYSLTKEHIMNDFLGFESIFDEVSGFRSSDWSIENFVWIDIGIPNSGGILACFKDRSDDIKTTPIDLYIIDPVNNVAKNYNLIDSMGESTYYPEYDFMKEIPGIAVGENSAFIGDYNQDGADEVIVFNYFNQHDVGRRFNMYGYDIKKGELIKYCEDIPFWFAGLVYDNIKGEIVRSKTIQPTAPFKLIEYKGMKGFELFTPEGWYFFEWDEENRKYNPIEKVDPAERIEIDTTMIDKKWPEISHPVWKDKNENVTTVGLTGETYTLSVDCNDDIEDGSEVIFTIYNYIKNPIEEVAVQTKDGKAELEWTSPLDSDDPKTYEIEKSNYFFIAKMSQVRQRRSEILRLSLPEESIAKEQLYSIHTEE